MKRNTGLATLAGGLAMLAGFVASGSAHAQSDKDCPNGGTVRFGVEPYEAAARLTPIYQHIGDLIGKKLGCRVEILITTNYTAEIEAMRAGRLEVGEFGPLGYVLAHQVAKAEAVATFGDAQGKPETYTAGIVTWPGSGITTFKNVAGHSFAFSDPASTSGHLYPAYALRKDGIDPDKGVKAFYAGSHGATFEAIRNHKVQAGELNSQEIQAATIAGEYKPADYVELWRSNPIPTDPIAIAPTLKPAFKSRLIDLLQTLDLHELSPDDLKIIGSAGAHLVPQTDAAYDGVRDLVKTLNIDLSKVAGVSGTLVEAAGLEMRYKTGRLALDDASLSVAAGELVVILGANGSGKSTMLRCIAGILRPTAGKVRVGGREISGLGGRALADARMVLGMIFQHANLVKRRSVLANVMTGTLGRHRNLLTAFGALPASERGFAQDCLRAVGLREFAPQRAGTLSGGQAQRVSIARALAQRPRVLMADEPVASLDPEAADEVMRLLRRVSREEGLAVLCVLHQPDLARRYADRVVGLRNGRISFDERPQSVCDRDVSALYEAAAA